MPVLRHGLVGWRHLDRRIYKAVQVEPVESLVVGFESFVPRLQVGACGIRIALENELFE